MTVIFKNRQRLTKFVAEIKNNFMTMINISLPDALRDYVEAKAEQGHYSASEYVRHLIREDQQRNATKERNLLWDYLAISARQLDEGDVVTLTPEMLLTAGRARRHSASS